MKKSLLVLVAALAAFSQTSRIIPTFPYGVSYDEGGTITPDTVVAVKGDFDSLTVNDYFRQPGGNGYAVKIGGESGPTTLLNCDGGSIAGFSQGSSTSFGDVAASSTTFVIMAGSQRNGFYSLNGTTITPATANSPTNSVYHNGTVFLSVYTIGVMQKSTNGINWDTVANGVTSGNLSDVVWNGSKWIVVGSDSVVITNDNADASGSWTARTFDSTGSIRGVFVDGTDVFAVTNVGAIRKSTDDGVTWLNSPSGTTTQLWSGACDGSGLCAAVGVSGVIRFTTNGGTSWAAAAGSGLVSTTLWRVEYADGKFVAVGDDGVILTSVDGDTWVQETSGETADLLGIAFAQSLWMAVGDDGRILTSPDAETWTRRGEVLAGCLPQFDTLAVDFLGGDAPKTYGGTGTFTDSTSFLSALNVKNDADDSTGAALNFYKSRDGGDVANRDTVVRLNPRMWSGSEWFSGAPFTSCVDGTFVSGQRPPSAWCVFANAANSSDVRVATFASDGFTSHLPALFSSTAEFEDNVTMDADLDIAGSYYTAGYAGFGNATSPTVSGSLVGIGSDVNAILEFSTHNSSGGTNAIRHMFSRGTRASPLPTQSGDFMKSYTYRAYDSSGAYNVIASDEVLSDGAQGAANRGAYLYWRGILYGSTTLQEQMRWWRGNFMVAPGMVSPTTMGRVTDTSFFGMNTNWNSDGGGWKIGFQTAGSKRAAAHFFDINAGTYRLAISSAAGAAGAAITWVNVMTATNTGVTFPQDAFFADGDDGAAGEGYACFDRDTGRIYIKGTACTGY